MAALEQDRRRLRGEVARGALTLPLALTLTPALTQTQTQTQPQTLALALALPLALPLSLTPNQAGRRRCDELLLRQQRAIAEVAALEQDRRRLRGEVARGALTLPLALSQTLTLT